MGLWGGLKSIGRGIGKGVKKVGKKIGQEVRRGFDPITKAVKGDWKGALAGIGHNIKRGAQIGAVLGTGGVAGLGLGTIGAAGGAIEGGFKEGGSVKGALGGAVSGYGGVQTGKAVGNIGRNIAGKVGSRGAEAVVANAGKSLAPGVTDAALQGATIPNVPVRDLTNQLVTGASKINMPSVTPLVSNVANMAGSGVSDVAPSLFDKAGGYLKTATGIENKEDLFMKGASKYMERPRDEGGPQDEPMMDPTELALLEREALMRELMMGGGSQYRPTSQYSARWT